jgi:hypothetical protein
MDGHNGTILPDNYLEAMFPDDNDLDETLMHCSKGKKFSNFNIKQDRTIILSNIAIYLLSQKEVR